jgi:hypothetical protein
VTHPTFTDYSACLDRELGKEGGEGGEAPACGYQAPFHFQTPKHPNPGCCASTYTDIHGKCRRINFNFPYALVIYRPRPLERYFQTKERAVLEAPRCGDWQIIHLPSGQIIYEPKRK